MFDRDLKSWKILMMHRFEKSSFEKYSVYTLTKNPIQFISPKFFTSCFSKGCNHVWVTANPMKILQIITVSYLIKISSIQVIFVFLYLLFDNREKKLHVHGYVSWKNSYFFYRNYSCTHVGTAAQIYIFCY